jgi:hypothetical protein
VRRRLMRNALRRIMCEPRASSSIGAWRICPTRQGMPPTPTRIGTPPRGTTQRVPATRGRPTALRAGVALAWQRSMAASDDARHQRLQAAARTLPAGHRSPALRGQGRLRARVPGGPAPDSCAARAGSRPTTCAASATARAPCRWATARKTGRQAGDRDRQHLERRQPVPRALQAAGGRRQARRAAGRRLSARTAGDQLSSRSSSRRRCSTATSWRWRPRSCCAATRWTARC